MNVLFVRDGAKNHPMKAMNLWNMGIQVVTFTFNLESKLCLVILRVEMLAPPKFP